MSLALWCREAKGASALGTECALNAHSIRIGRVRTRNVKVPNRIECALSQSTSVCGLNPVTSGLEWNVRGRSLRHMREVCTRTRTFAHWVGSRNAVDGCWLGLRGGKGFVGYLGGC